MENITYDLHIMLKITWEHMILTYIHNPSKIILNTNP